MKYLKDEFTKRGYIYKLKSRGEKALMYAQYDDESLSLVGYEVFKIKISEEKTVFDKTYETQEKFPSDEHFGKWAWTFLRSDYGERKAIEKFNQLEEV